VDSLAERCSDVENTYMMRRVMLDFVELAKLRSRLHAIVVKKVRMFYAATRMMTRQVSGSRHQEKVQEKLKSSLAVSKDTMTANHLLIVASTLVRSLVILETPRSNTVLDLLMSSATAHAVRRLYKS